MSQEVRVRFAPSPTGHVHIGNIRAAIFNWLFARNQNGKFLLRVEDTDKERSTPEAIDSLLDCMEWLGLDYDEEPLYQSTQADHHLATVAKLQEEGRAYRYTKGDAEVTLFRFPYDVENFKTISKIGEATQELHTDQPVIIDKGGITFALVSKKGKAVPQENMTLAGFTDLKVFNEAGECIFELNPEIDEIYNGKVVELAGAVKMTFTRHKVSFTDLVKGELSKPLDSMKDLVLVKSDGSPLFHLANICDDITQGMTHIVRGDDHVENTYRHVVIYEAMGHAPAQYAHLPMIVNASGKPYSKRDGDAFVGDFRTKGYLPEALFNYLLLLGWSPGENTEKVTKEEAIAAFNVAKVKSTAAQMDIAKLTNLNGQYLAEKPTDEFVALIKKYIADYDWYKEDDAYLTQVAALMTVRTKLATDVADWKYFYTEGVEQVEGDKNVRKTLKKEGMTDNLNAVAEALEAVTDWNPEAIEAAVSAVSEAKFENAGRLNKPVRMAVTAAGGGADLYPPLSLIGKERVIARLKTCADRDCTVEG
ncbi:MAG: glutamate--tRNA ligase [Lentisphaerales bacterium]|nr:glutamate--tRNA ligase [Lentisphaerales bacterium]